MDSLTKKKLQRNKNKNKKSKKLNKKKSHHLIQMKKRNLWRRCSLERSSIQKMMLILPRTRITHL